MRKIQRIQPSPHVQGRYLVFLADGQLLKVTEEEMLRFSLYAGLELEEERFAQLSESALDSQAKATAARIVSTRALSKGELVQKLVEKGHRRDLAQEAADYLESIGAIDDGQYARILVRHYAARGYGQRKIQSEFYRRKVPQAYWADALAEMEPPEDTIDQLIEKKLRGNPSPDRKELNKVSAFLARRGFGWDEIRAGLNRYGAQAEEFETNP